jgi:putative acetyltransferase
MTLEVRRVRAGEERRLWDIFHASVRGVARSHYSEEQVAAWSPAIYPGALWEARIQANRSFVAVIDGEPCGFSDIREDGYIDQFFVADTAVRCGVGSALMTVLIDWARKHGLARMHSRVSLSAQGFFGRHGFVIETEQSVLLRGVVLRNATMVKMISDQRSALTAPDTTLKPA